ncbi:MAG: GHMP kinase [Chloroflexi bacterium]|nr:GHMP kinase [Chloroflexota bacterium]
MSEPFTATVQLPGSCGELVQGSYKGTPFHVTCPINMYSTVTVKLHPGQGKATCTERFAKAASAVRLTLQHLGRGDLDAGLSIESSLPPGKGMASSTADVAGAIIATGLALGRQLEPVDVAGIALSVEPSDGTFFPGIVAFDHRGGKMHFDLGAPPQIEIVVLDFGGEVDTIAFNRQDRSAILRRLEPQVEKALELVKQGLTESRPDLVGEAATVSALANQSILHKPQLEPVMLLARQAGALGVNVAHSGTVIGVLLEAGKHDVSNVTAFLRANLPGLEKVYTARLVGGGARPSVRARPFVGARSQPVGMPSLTETAG